MKIYNCTQGSDEWQRLRLGKPTASQFHRIITAKKRDMAEGRHTYRAELLAEMIIGEPLDAAGVAALEHGKQWEPAARAAYEFDREVTAQLVGFCTTDDGLVGASPDALVGDDGLLEIKCPFKPAVHVAHLLNNCTLVDAHYPQVQGQLYVTGRKWCDLVSYHLGMPMVCVRVDADEDYQAALAIGLKFFCSELSESIERAKDAGWIGNGE